MATSGPAETPVNSGKVNNCDSSKLVNGSADPDFNSQENNNAMKEGYPRYNHHPPPAPYDPHRNSNSVEHKGGGMDAPPDYQHQQYPPQQHGQYPPYRPGPGYEGQAQGQGQGPPNNNGAEGYPPQHPGYPPPQMRYSGKPMPGGPAPQPHGYPPPGMRAGYPPPGQSISQQPSGQTPTLNQLLQSPGGANAGATPGPARYPPPPQGYEHGYPPNHAQGPAGWPPANAPRPPPHNSYAHPPPFQQQQQPQQPMYRQGSPSGGSRGGPPQPQSGQPQQHPSYYHPQGPPHHPGYPPPPQSPHYPPPHQRYPSPGPGMRPPDNQPPYPQHPPSINPQDNSGVTSDPPKSTPPPPPSPSLTNHGQNPPSPSQSPRSTPHPPPVSSASSLPPPPNSPSHRPQGSSPSNSYPPPDVGEVTGCNSNDSVGGANSNQPGPRPSPSPTGSAGSRSMSPAVGNQNIPMPPRPSSSQSDGSAAPRMSQSPMPGQGGPYPGQPMAPPPHHMYQSGGKHGSSGANAVPPHPQGPSAQSHYPPPSQPHWQGAPPPGGYRPPGPQQQPPQHGHMMSPYPPPGQQPPQNNYNAPRHPNHIGGPPPQGGSQYPSYPSPHYPPPQGNWPGAPSQGAPPRSQMHPKQQLHQKITGYPQGYPMGPPGPGMPGPSPSQTPPPHPHHSDPNAEGSGSSSNPPNLVSVGPDGANVDELSQQSTISNASGASGGDDGPPMPKLRPEGGARPYPNYPTTPQGSAVPSPGAASMNSAHDEYGEINSPSWPKTPASPGLNSHPPPPSDHFKGKNKKADSLNKLYEMDENPERRMFLDKLIHFMEENNSPIASCPTISKNPLDLFKLYLYVKERGGFLEVSKNKTWKDIAGSLGIGASSSAAYTLRKHYTKHLFPFECKFDRGGVDPLPLITQVETSTKKKGKTVAPVPSPGSSNSQDSFPGPNNNTNSSSMDGFNSPASSNYPSYGQPPVSGEYPGGNAGSSSSPHARPPTAPNQNMQPSSHPGDKISASNPFDDQYPQHYHQQSRPNYISPYSPYPSSGYPGPPGSYPPYPPQGEQYPNRPPPPDGYPNQAYGRPYPYGDPAAQGGYPGQPQPPPPSAVPGQGQGGNPPSSQNSAPSADERYGPQGGTPPAGYPPRGPAYPAGLPGSQASSAQPAGPPPNGYPNQEYYSGQPDPAYQGGKQMPPPGGMRYPPPPSKEAPGQYPSGYPPGPGGQQRVPPYAWPNSGGHYPGQQRGYPTPPSATPPQPSPVPSQSPGVSAQSSTPPQQAASPQPWAPSGPPGGPPRPGPPPNAAGSQGPPPPPPGATWPTQDPRYAQTQGGIMPSAAATHSAQPPWTPPGSQSRTPSRSPFPPSGGKPAAEGFRGYGPSPPVPGKGLPVPQTGPVPTMPSPTPYPSGPSSVGKKDITFPPDCVEAVTPVLTRRKKLHKHDVSPVEAWRIMMSLKSGLLAEVTWALDVLNVLLYDDQSVSYFSLTYLPGLLDILLEHLRKALILLFGQSVGIDLAAGRTEDGNLMKPVKWYERKERTEEDEPDLGTPTTKFPRDCHRTQVLQTTQNYTLVSKINGRKIRVVARDEEPFVVPGVRDWDMDEKSRSDPDLEGLCGTTELSRHIVTYFCTTLPTPLRIVRDLKAEDSSKESDCAARPPKTSDLNSDMYRCDVKFPKILVEPPPTNESNSNSTNVPSNPATPISNSVNTKKLENGPVSVENSPIPAVPEKKNCELFPTPLTSLLQNSKNSIVQKKAKRLDDLLGRIRKEHTEDDNAVSEPPIPVTQQEDIKPVVVVPIKVESEEKEEVIQPVIENGLSDVVGGSDNSNLSAANSENTCDSNKHLKSIEMKFGDITVRDPGATLKRKRIEEYEDECYTRDESSLYLVTESQDSLARRCLSICNIIRNLTFVPGNEMEFGKCAPFLSLMGKLILLHHDHPLKRQKAKQGDSTTKPERAADSEPASDEKSQENDTEATADVQTPEEGALSDTPSAKCEDNIQVDPDKGNEPVPEDPEDEPLFAEDVGSSDLASAAVEIEADSCTSLTNDEEWWWDYVHHIREHVLVMIANISGQMDLSQYSEEISRPILDGLLHWAVCPAAYGQDPFPTLSPGSYLSPQRLAIEALVKLSVIQGNVDLLLATPPYSRIEKLCQLLCRSLCRTEEQVMREFALNLLYYLSAADSGVARTIALQNPCISLLISFIEQAEHNAMSIANNHGFAVLRDNPEAMGTSLDMLRRAAMTLLNLARHPDNRSLFVQHEPRLLQLVMSQILEQKVAAMVAQVLYQCSTPDATCSQKYLYASNLDTFYTPLFSRSRSYPQPHHHMSQPSAF